MSAATTVPPSAGLSTRSRPSRTASRSARPTRPLPSGRAPPTPSSRTRMLEGPVLDARPRRRTCGTRVLCDVGQRLGDDEVRRRLDRSRQPVHGHVDLDRHGRPRGQRLDARAQAAAREDRREEALRELAQLFGRQLRLLDRLAYELGRGFGVRPERLVGLLQGDDGLDEALLRSVVQVANHAPAFPSAAATIRERDAARSDACLDVRDRGRDELRERRHALLGVGRELLALRRGAHRAPERPLDHDRDRHGATNPQPLRHLRRGTRKRGCSRRREPTGRFVPPWPTPCPTRASDECPPASRRLRSRCWRRWSSSRQARAARSSWPRRRRAAPAPRRRLRRPPPRARPSRRASPRAAAPPARPQDAPARPRPAGAPSRRVPSRT